MTNKEICKKLAELRLEERRIKQEIEQLTPQVIDIVLATGEKRGKIDEGVFTVSLRRVWTFSSDYTAAEEALEAMKTVEQQTGKATFVEKPQLTFKAIKNEGEEN